jgi:hypothetical protein
MLTEIYWKQRQKNSFATKYKYTNPYYYWSLNFTKPDSAWLMNSKSFLRKLLMVEKRAEKWDKRWTFCNLSTALYRGRQASDRN